MFLYMIRSHTGCGQNNVIELGGLDLSYFVVGEDAVTNSTKHKK